MNRRLTLKCALALLIGAATHTAAAGGGGGWEEEGGVKTIASGLNNPRGLAFAPFGALFVVEMGNGGTGPCIPSPVAPAPRCFGSTGAITLVAPHGSPGFKRLVKGLPSLGLPTGSAEGGAADISFFGLNAYVMIGFGGDPAQRAALGSKGKLFGHLVRVGPWGKLHPIADVAGHEVKANPYGGAIDSNPYGLLALPGRRIVADAGANALIEVDWKGRTKTFAALPAVSGGRDPVPTAVAEGPDGAVYVSQLTGFPFWRGSSEVLRISSDGSSITTHASGFTAAVDIAVDHDGALYVLEVASGQVLPFPPPAPGLGVGRLVRQCPGGAQEVLLANLSFPGGVALGPDGAVYLTNNGTSPTAGEVLRLPVSRCK